MKGVYKVVLAVAAIISIVAAIVISSERVKRISGELARYKRNTETLLSDVETYRVRDSLNAARVQSLELTVDEYERFRAADAELIRTLQTRNRDLAAVNKTQSETIIRLSAIGRDTVVIVRDSIQVPAAFIHCGDAWFDFDGIFADNVFTGELRNRDSLIVAETVKYKRFLGFLWKTHKVQDRRVDVVSKNPHTAIIGMEYITIEH